MSDQTPTGPVRSQYEDFMRHVFTTGEPRHDRTGTGTVSVFGHQMRFDLGEGRRAGLSRQRVAQLIGQR